MQSLPALCLMGPSAMGKSVLALRLAEVMPVEIVSVDAALVYQGMDVGTAKPSREDRRKYPHWLIDVCDPAEHYSVGRFYQDVSPIVDDIKARGKIPLLVGGTMMYFRALQQGLAALPTADKALREDLQRTLRERGAPSLHQTLGQVDKKAATRIAPTDRQRILRALEVWYLTGTPISEWQQQSGHKSQLYRFYGWMPSDRSQLHEAISNRFHDMLDRGLVEEVRHFYERGDLSLDDPSMRSIGYRQVWQYLMGMYSLTEMTQRAVYATRQLVKRQCTWLRSWPDVNFLPETIDTTYALLARECAKLVD